MIITNRFLLDNRTKAGAYTKAQLRVLGISWPPYKNWKQDVIGRVLTEEQVKEFRDAVQMRCRSSGKKSRSKNTRKG